VKVGSAKKEFSYRNYIVISGDRWNKEGQLEFIAVGYQTMLEKFKETPLLEP
jgi:hypothetical protein